MYMYVYNAKKLNKEIKTKECKHKAAHNISLCNDTHRKTTTRTHLITLYSKEHNKKKIVKKHN